MTMDAEMVEILIGNVRSLWARPLSDYEEGIWLRMLKPADGPALDPELVCQTLLAIKDRPQFAHSRPDVIAFRGHYDHLVDLSKPPEPDPSDMPITAEENREHLDEVRALMADKSTSNEDEKSIEGQLL